MQAECTQYKKAKRHWLNGKNTDVDKKRWELFLDVAKSGAALKRECLAPLTKASAGWGNEKVQHHEWAFMGLRYCKVLGTAATRNPTWTEASIKLNQLLFMRISDQQPLKTLNPLELTDRECLKIWQGQNGFKKSGRNGFELQYRPISNAKIPSGYALDRYGLLVCEEFGSPREKIFDRKTQSASFNAGKRDWKYQGSPAPIHTQYSSQLHLPEAREEANALIDED